MYYFEDDFWRIFWRLLVFMFKLILYASPILIWVAMYYAYLEADDAEREIVMYLGGGVLISMAICFLKNINETKSSFMQLYKDSLVPINIFTDIIFIVL